MADISENEQVSDIDELAEYTATAPVDLSIVSFSQLEDQIVEYDFMQSCIQLSNIFNTLLYNIRVNCEINGGDSREMVQKLFAEFSSKFSAISGSSTKESTTILEDLKRIFSKEANKKTENGKKFSSSAFLYVPDPNKPSTWKLRIEEEPGKVTIAQLGRAAAAFSSGGFRGNKVQVPSGEVSAIKRRLRGLYKKLGASDDEIPESIRKEVTEQSFDVWKTKDGSMRFMATYSNNYRDEDHPAQIISSKSHKDFVERVDRGESKMPVLQHWHIKGTEYGQADWVAYDEDNGVAMASGEILPGHEDEAIALSELDEDIALSHGMPILSLEFDKEDSSVITRHDTVEISDLPRANAANKLTNLYFLKEGTDMAIPEAKKEYLKKLGFTDERIKAIEEGNSAVKQVAEEANIESKEDASAAAQTPVEEVKEESKPVEPAFATKEMIDMLKAETAEAITTAISITADALTKQLEQVSAAIVKLSEKISDLEKDKTETTNLTPMASIASIVSRNLSAVGAKETKVKEGDSLLGQKHREAQKDENEPQDLMSVVFKNIIGGK